MSRTKTRPWGVEEHLENAEDMAAYLEAALEEGDPALIVAAIGDMARAKGITQIARETGLGRESLCRALSPEGNPEFATVLKVMRALGLKLHATPIAADFDDLIVEARLKGKEAGLRKSESKFSSKMSRSSLQRTGCFSLLVYRI